MTTIIYAAYDAGSDEVLGFYRSDVHATIPTPNLVISDVEHAQAIVDQEAGKTLKVTGGALVSILPAIALTVYRDRAKGVVDGDAAALVSTSFPFADSQAFLLMARVHEATMAASDGARTQSEYPLLAAKVLAEGGSVTHASLGVAATGTDTELATIRADLAGIEEVRMKAHIDLDAAVDAAAIDSVLAAISWPA